VSDDIAPGPVAGENGAEPGVETSAVDPAEQGWRRDRQQRWFTPAKGRSGVVYRRDNETVEEALARDAKGPKDREPRSKKSRVPRAPAPTQVSLKELEFALSELFCSPAFVAAGRGEEWAANHFTKEGPVLARNLTKAAEHNPWLRAKLEAAVTGEALMVKVMTIIPVAAALIAYSLPPVIYYFDPGFIPPEAREMFHVPVREKKDEPDAESPPGAETAEASEPAAAVAAAA
jgi:hypothetical protein